MKLALISDDLTGALDASVVFAARGLRTLVAISGDHFAEALGSGADIVAVSLNTREASKVDAVRLTKTAIGLVPQSIPVFKKIDSRMKGHVRAEVQAIASAIRAQHVIICPAIPSLKRYVADGRVMGAGIAEPIDLAGYSGCGESEAVWNFPDARTDADMDAIVRQAPSQTLLCGARGLAEALARKLVPDTSVHDFANVRLPHPILFAIGSRDLITVAQVETLRDKAPDMAYMAATNGSVEHPLEPSCNLILQTVAGAEKVPSEMVTRNFAHSVASKAVSGRATLVLTGGETAAATLSNLGFGILEIVGEPQAGIPASIPLGKTEPVVITKSGGLGAHDALVRLAGLQTGGEA